MTEVVNVNREYSPVNLFYQLLTGLIVLLPDKLDLLQEAHPSFHLFYFCSDFAPVWCVCARACSCAHRLYMYECRGQRTTLVGIPQTSSSFFVRQDLSQAFNSPRRYCVTTFSGETLHTHLLIPR